MQPTLSSPRKLVLTILKRLVVPWVPVLLPVTVLISAAVLSLSWQGAPVMGQVFFWGFMLSHLMFYGFLYRMTSRGEWLPKWLLWIFLPIFNWYSIRINKPMILVLRKNHYFFLSYGILQALGGALAVLYLKVFFVGSDFSIPVEALVLGLVVPILGGNRFAGLLSQVYVEGLNWKEALFRVRFLSVGAVIGGIIAILGVAWWWNFPVAVITDAVFTSLLWAQIFGSLGCLYYGCCHGEVRGDGQGITYAHPSLKPNRVLGLKTICVTPTPIYCALFGAWILAFALFLRFAFDLPVGFLTAFVGTCFGLSRYSEEWFRFDSKASTRTLFINQSYTVVLMAISIGIGLGNPSPAIWKAQSLESVVKVISESSSYALPVMILLAMSFIYSYHHGEIGSWKLKLTAI